MLSPAKRPAPNTGFPKQFDLHAHQTDGIFCGDRFGRSAFIHIQQRLLGSRLNKPCPALSMFLRHGLSSCMNLCFEGFALARSRLILLMALLCFFRL